MATRIDLSSELGEGFGLYEIAPEADIVPYVTSAHVAGGFHAGDPHTMRETIELAARHDVAVGAHPGLPDRIGFGRRTLDATPEQVADYVTYQIGAVGAVARRAGLDLQYVKPHGALYTMLAENEELCRTVLDAVHAVDEDLVFVPVDPSLYEVARDSPVPTVLEGYVDLPYDEAGHIVVPAERNPGLDPDLVAERFVRIAVDEEVETRSGEVIDLPARTVCVHGDNPNAVAVLERIHQRAAEAGVELVPMTELL
jgi:UPF0271 protein